MSGVSLPDWLGGIDFVQAAFIVAVGLAVIWTVVKKLWPALTAIVKLSEMLKATPKFQKETKEMLGRLRAQVENSHNTNMRDELTEALDLAKKTAASVEGLHSRIDKLETNDTEQAGILTDMQSKLGRDHKRITVIEETMPRDQLGRFTKKEEDK